MSQSAPSVLRALRLPALLVILTLVVVWGNLEILNRLSDISHQSAPMPLVQDPGSDQDPAAYLEVVDVGVVSRFAPNRIYRLYQPIMDYLDAHSDAQHQLSLSRTYQEAAQTLQQGQVQASFLGAWMVAHLPPESNLKPVAVPVDSTGKSQFHVVLVVPEDSDIQSLADLAGRRVAVPSAQAFSGNWLQTTGLAGVGLKEADLDTLQHFNHHETVIWQVLRGHFDAGVVKESLALNNRDRGLITVSRSPAIPGPPLVIRKDDTSAATANLVNLLLKLDRNNPQDQALMKGWTPEFAHGFMPVDEALFRRHFGTDSNPGGQAP